jgi:hypothetical protein
MNYIAQLYFKIEMQDQKKSQFDCQLRIIQSDSEEEAFFIAKEIGLKEESQFVNDKGQLVKWNFAGITEIKEMNLLENGAMIFSSTIETDKKDDFLLYIHTKSRDLALNLSKKELIFSL